VTGVGRIVYCSAAVALVLAFYKNAFAIPRAISAPLTHLGVLTYGVYLLHPIAYPVVLLALKKLHLQPGPYVVIVATIFATVVLAQASYKLMEEPFIRIGKKLTAKPAAASNHTREVREALGSAPQLQAANDPAPGPVPQQEAGRRTHELSQSGETAD
jgi:exopolysaccharide production protein ExoZ